ncbi:uncharacterized protein LOC126888777 [Diabrotica virgifera virgifera]|uniref:Uncharacterized protein LOC114338474 n=1 Tax=Diabrotica virgifera virgifera TaxID=50390 RepID=A0A6P7GM69_DIAVI|nr:uncharacterized protein LOC126888777 [Diabrotica virgifera virgifera]
MEEVKKPSYKYCMVPQCKNTTRSTPNKLFFRIPNDRKLRKQWCKMMRRDTVSPASCLYCCEDHFNVKEDTANYIEYTIMKEQGEKCYLRLKKGVVPHTFLCQKRNMPLPAERMGAVKRQKLTLVNEALSKFAVGGNCLETVVIKWSPALLILKTNYQRTSLCK